ncbi:hypothetical protein CEXT_813601 [Caerostris extrusa]|uniref:Uncharacterized protein n=1 Tax=Caerostris extrusa TaxID=172846 RepID=A0AAV4YB66_CAEEX|nr:hypothetical protein CEXT_813601 [Caerostris extrusa]
MIVYIKGTWLFAAIRLYIPKRATSIPLFPATQLQTLLCQQLDKSFGFRIIWFGGERKVWLKPLWTEGVMGTHCLLNPILQESTEVIVAHET